MPIPAFIRLRKNRHAIIAPPIGIDRSNYLVGKGITAFWILGFGRPIDVTGNFNQSVPVGTPGTYAGPHGGEHFGELSTSTNYWTVNNGAILGGKANWTVVAGVRAVNHRGNAETVYSERAASGNDILNLGGSGTSSLLVCTYRNDAGTLVNPTTGAVIMDGQFHIIGGSKSPAAVAQYKDGILDISTAWNTNDNFTNASIVVHIGNSEQNLANSGWSEFIQFVGIFPWTFTADDHANFARDPYQFLIFPNDVVLSQLRGVPAEFLTPDEVDLTFTTFAPDLFISDNKEISPGFVNLVLSETAPNFSINGQISIPSGNLFFSESVINLVIDYGIKVTKLVGFEVLEQDDQIVTKVIGFAVLEKSGLRPQIWISAG